VKKNVILLSIDTLAFKRLGIAGNDPSPSPFLDSLSLKSHSMFNCLSMGCPTQIAFPSIMSSSFPLDEGGYERGIMQREISLAESFKQKGYKTAAFGAFNNFNYYHYHRGFSEYNELMSLLPKVTGWQNAYVNFYKSKPDLFENQTATSYQVLNDYLEFLNYLEGFCIERHIESEKESHYTIYRWDFKPVLEKIKRQKALLEAKDKLSIKTILELSNKLVETIERNENKEIKK